MLPRSKDMPMWASTADEAADFGRRRVDPAPSRLICWCSPHAERNHAMLPGPAGWVSLHPSAVTAEDVGALLVFWSSGLLSSALCIGRLLGLTWGLVGGILFGDACLV